MRKYVNYFPIWCCRDKAGTRKGPTVTAYYGTLFSFQRSLSHFLLFFLGNALNWISPFGRYSQLCLLSPTLFFLTRGFPFYPPDFEMYCVVSGPSNNCHACLCKGRGTAWSVNFRRITRGRLMLGVVEKGWARPLLCHSDPCCATPCNSSIMLCCTTQLLEEPHCYFPSRATWTYSGGQWYFAWHILREKPHCHFPSSLSSRLPFTILTMVKWGEDSASELFLQWHSPSPAFRERVASQYITFIWEHCLHT